MNINRNEKGRSRTEQSEKIVIFDHSSVKSISMLRNHIMNECDIHVALGNVGSGKNPFQNYKETPITIFHWTKDDKAIDTFEKQSLRGTVRIRGTVGGSYEPNIEVNEKGVYCLTIGKKLISEVPSAVWAKLLRHFTKIVEEGNLISKQELTASMPSDVRALFLMKSDFEQCAYALCSLDILLQGYLAVHRPAVVFGGDYKKIFAKHKILQDTRRQEHATEVTQYTTGAPQRLFRSSASETRNNEQGYYWFDECLSDVQEKSWKELTDLNPALQGKTSLECMWKLLRGECLGLRGDAQVKDGWLLSEKCSGWSQDGFTRLFEEAHMEYVSVLTVQDKKKHEQFEAIRSTVNHNLIKNEFLFAIGSGHPNSIEDRRQQIIDVWASSHNDEASTEEIADKKNNIRLGLDIGSIILDKLHSLFEEEPQSHDLVLTDTGQELKEELIGENNTVMTTITHFLNHFEEIGKTNRGDRLDQLEQFWKAADRLHEALSKMAQGNRVNGLEFGGYLEDLHE